MANYADLDESELQRMLGEADSYEERSAIRQALRQKKKERGGVIGRAKGGNSVYNRFAGASRKTAAPKNYVAAAATETPKTAPVVSKPTKPTSTPPPRQVDTPPHVVDKEEPSPLPTPEPSSPPPSQDSPPTPEPSSPSPEPEPEPSPPTPEPEPPSPEPSPPTPEPPRESPEPTPPPTPESDGVDGSGDPGLGEEGGEESVPDDQEPEAEPVPVETEEPTPKARDRAIEEHDGIRSFGSRSEARSRGSQPVDFGVKLKKTPPQTKSKPTSSPAGSGSPRTLRDYQAIAARTRVPKSPASEGPPLEGGELQKYLVAYVNRELGLSPPLPAKGRALYEKASDATNLCKLINKSVPNTVDLRALTRVPVRGSAEAKREAVEENMVLVVESARAIGCKVTDYTGDQIINGDPTTIRDLLVDLIRARVVHLPGMEDEPGSTFTNMSTLFSKLGISVDSVDGEEPPVTTPTADEAPPKQDLTYEERAALRKAEREKKRSSDYSSGNGHEMTYEERAAQRKLERERRRREREALAK